MIQYAAAPAIKPKLHGVLDARLRGHDREKPAAYAASESFGKLASTVWLRPPALAA